MPDRPNVLWLMCDQLRHHALSCNGDPNVSTPNLDRLAAQGCRFTHAFTSCPVCTPARGALVTGQFNHVNGVPRHGDLLPPDRRTVAHAFRDAGYRTCWVGKWHLASVQSGERVSSGYDCWVHPLLRGGFQDWYGFDYSNQFYETYYTTDEQISPAHKVEGYQTDGLTDLTLDWLDRAAGDDQPWLHCWSVEAPHGGGGPGRSSVPSGNPAPPEYIAMFDPDKLILRDNVPAEDEPWVRERLRGYYAQIANLDHNVGRILTRLDELSLTENTIVVFFTDHGEMGGSHGLREKYHIYDESIRIPILVRYPERIPAGQVSDALASIVDIFPTCASLAGVPTPPEVQGLDLFGSPRREGVLIQWVDYALYNFNEKLYRCLRTSRYTYEISEDGRERLFDNQADPYQMQNLAEEPTAQDALGDMRRQLRTEMLHLGDAPPEWVK
jgi:arylsulfatase A-like enzyme